MAEKEESMGFMEAAKEGVKEFTKGMFSGLSLEKMVKEIGAELKDQLAAGAHELASVLFRGDAFVMYPRNGVEEELTIESMKAEIERDQQKPQQEHEQGRDGMSR